MLTHSRRRLVLACAVVGTLAAGAIAGPAMAAGDADSPAPECRKAGGDQQEYVPRPRKAGGETQDIIAVL